MLPQLPTPIPIPPPPGDWVYNLRPIAAIGRIIPAFTIGHTIPWHDGTPAVAVDFGEEHGAPVIVPQDTIRVLDLPDGLTVDYLGLPVAELVEFLTEAFNAQRDAFARRLTPARIHQTHGSRN